VPRRLFTVAAALSLLLCAATIVLWVRSEYHQDAFRIQKGARDFLVLDSESGAVNLIRVDYVDPRTGQFVLRSGSVRLTIPFFLPLALSVVLAIAFLLAARPRTRGRAKAGLCRACGYDLRASKERCPECGTPIPSTAGPAENPTISN